MSELCLGVKRCTLCGIDRDRADFHRKGSSKDGLNSRCKPCNNAAAATYIKLNPEKVSAANAARYKVNNDKVRAASAARYRADPGVSLAYARANKGRINAARKARRDSNPEKTKQLLLAWRLLNPEKSKAAVAAWKRANPASGRAASRRWRVANLDRSRAASAARSKANPDARRAKCQDYRAKKRKATPAWDMELTAFTCLEAARLCSKRAHMGLGDWHIDHVIPMQGRKVCGLHVWSNLAVVPARFNLAKNNHFSESRPVRGWL